MGVTSDFIGFAQRTASTSHRRILHQSLTTKTLILSDEGSFLFANNIAWPKSKQMVLWPWAVSYRKPILSCPKPQRIQSMRKTSQSTCRFFLFDNPIHKIISSTNIKNYYNNSIEYTLKVGRSFKK